MSQYLAVERDMPFQTALGALTKTTLTGTSEQIAEENEDKNLSKQN